MPANIEPVAPLIGGALIGISATVMLLFHGRIAGITGIVAGLTTDRVNGDILWRVLFIAGLILGGTLAVYFIPQAFALGVDRSFGAIALAGLLVGFGTRLGSGCTSGHGVCGVSRMAPRSLVATATFLATGMITVFIISHVFGGAL